MSNDQSMPIVIPASVVRQGDGTYLVRAGRPLERLTPRQLAHHLGVSRNAVYRYIEEGWIPASMVSYVGPRKIFIACAAVAHLLERSRSGRI